MSRQIAIVLYVVAMAAVIVGVDFVFAAFHLRFLSRP
jgi:preprotein translocase subunit SecE